MKHLSLLVLICTLGGILACQQKDGTSTKNTTTTGNEKKTSATDPNGVPDAVDLQKEYASWYKYTYYTIHLAQDFMGLDADSTELAKQSFLHKLAAGQHIPIRIARRDGVPIYRLYAISGEEASIRSTIRQMATQELANTALEGKPLPAFAFTDLQKKKYTSTTTRNKVLVLKCWFVACVACVKEFPDLNQLVAKHEANKEVEFVSLALDSPQKLREFLAKKPFSYAVVPNMEEYIQNRLGIGMYPTHILVDRAGTIVKVTNSVEDLLPFLERQVALSTL